MMSGEKEEKFTQDWEMTRSKGMFKHSIKLAAMWGLPMFLIMTFVFPPPSKSVLATNTYDTRMIITDFIIYTVTGFLMGLWVWHRNEKQYKKIKGISIPKPSDLDKTKDAIRFSYISCFVVAAIQAIIIIILSYSNITHLAYFTEVIFLVGAGGLLLYKKSRFVAVMLLIYAALFGLGIYDSGDKNIIYILLAMFLIFASYVAVAATFKYHKIIGTKINTQAAVQLNLVIIIYSAVTTLAVAYGYYTLLEKGMISAVSDTVMGIVELMVILLIVVMCLFGKLPFTKNLKLTYISE